ncbi:hypothetical protein Q7C36_023467 [Tachysurus vachellii]|uniref:Uncharacterized protein n=1 Tax=Tachysurus vachellii TaxID=175792 RepID=A0AA88LMZ3_TACVA|nr:hypothetical protein Q7C36_023467 [Tachysurus vachellii]
MTRRRYELRPSDRDRLDRAGLEEPYAGRVVESEGNKIDSYDICKYFLQGIARAVKEPPETSSNQREPSVKTGMFHHYFSDRMELWAASGVV